MDSAPLMVAIVVLAIGLGFLAALILGRKWNRIGSLADRAGALLNGHPFYHVSPQAIVGLDSSGNIRSLNQAAAQLFGCDLRGLPISCLIRGAATKRLQRHPRRP